MFEDTSQFRIMQCGSSTFYVEERVKRWFGRGFKWRPLTQTVGAIPMAMTIYFPEYIVAERYARECKEYRNGPKIAGTV